MIQLHYRNALINRLTDQGLSFYETSMPDSSAKYPFIFVPDAVANEGAIKSGRTGTLTQTLHVWSDQPHRRGDCYRLVERVVQICTRIHEAGPYGLMLVDKQIRPMTDDTTATPFLHVVVELTYNFS